MAYPIGRNGRTFAYPEEELSHKLVVSAIRSCFATNLDISNITKAKVSAVMRSLPFNSTNEYTKNITFE